MFKKKIIFVLAILAFYSSIIYCGKNDQLPDIDINPNPMEKSTTININFTQEIQAEIVIETETGQVVKTLFTGNIDPGVYQFYWNRYDDQGEYVPEGIYYLSIDYNTRYTSTKKTLILK